MEGEGGKAGSGAITTWPLDERPREKLLTRGADKLTPTELLAALLRTGEGGGRTAIDLGRELWSGFGEDWGRLMNAAPGELCSIQGIGPAKAATIAAAMEIARRASSVNFSQREEVRAAADVYAHYRGRLPSLNRECFWALLLDARGRLIREEEISIGTLTGSLVHPREAFRSAVRESAASVIFVHNHPSGDPAPSEEDLLLTKKLFEAAKVLDIRLSDHVIVAACGYYSFFEGVKG